MAAATGTRAGFGVKSFGFLTSVALLTNNIAGIDLLSAGVVMQYAGWLVGVAATVVVAALAWLACVLLAKAIASLPDNADFKYRVEFTRLAQRLFPGWVYVVATVAVVANLLLHNADSVGESAVILDNTLVHAAGRTCGVVFAAGGVTAKCIQALPAAGDDDATAPTLRTSPWGGDYVVSLGWLVVVFITAPLSLLALADTWVLQLVAAGGRLVAVLVWAFQLGALGFGGGALPAVAPAASYGAVNFLDVVVFMFGITVTVPSWLNEKQRRVPIVLVASFSVAFVAALYVTLGTLTAAAFVLPPGGDLAAALLAAPDVWGVSTVAVYAFPFCDLLARIPVYAIVARYNLLNTRALAPWLARVLVLAGPPLLALVDYSGSPTHTALVWVGIFALPLISYAFPASTYLALRSAGADRYTLPIEMSNEEVADAAAAADAADAAAAATAARRLRPRDRGAPITGVGSTSTYDSMSVVSFLLPSWTRNLVASARPPSRARRSRRARARAGGDGSSVQRGGAADDGVPLYSRDSSVAGGGGGSVAAGGGSTSFSRAASSASSAAFYPIGAPATRAGAATPGAPATPLMAARGASAAAAAAVGASPSATSLGAPHFAPVRARAPLGGGLASAASTLWEHISLLYLFHLGAPGASASRSGLLLTTPVGAGTGGAGGGGGGGGGAAGAVAGRRQATLGGVGSDVSEPLLSLAGSTDALGDGDDRGDDDDDDDDDDADADGGGDDVVSSLGTVAGSAAPRQPDAAARAARAAARVDAAIPIVPRCCAGAVDEPRLALAVLVTSAALTVGAFVLQVYGTL